MKRNSIAIVTSTLYKNWHPRSVTTENQIDKVRGNLALEMFSRSLGLGLQIMVVDSGSSIDFVNEIKKLGVPNLTTNFSGTFSESRRTGYKIAAALADVKVIVWTEPEKSNLINNSLIEACKTIENGTADVVVPRRSKKTMESLPPFQKESEELGNKQIREMTNKDLDIFFGPKIFSARPDVVELFLEKFEYKDDSKNNKDSDLEKWLNSISFPIISALIKNYKVIDYEIDYVHPKSQTEIEKGNPAFDEKRIIQRENLIKGISELLKYYKNPEESSLKK